MSPPLYITGHSLGAARAALYAFSRVKRGLPVAGVYLFGCPNPGDRHIGLTLSSVPVQSYRNRRDLVTDVPVDLDFLNEEYVKPAPVAAFNEKAPSGDSWGVFSDHHSELYLAGAEKLTAPAIVTPAEAALAIIGLYNGAGDWSWSHLVDGQYWAMRTTASGARILVARGSTTLLDWIHDFDALQTDVYGARVSEGFWAGVGPIEAVLDGAA